MPASPEEIVKDIEELQGILTTIAADLEEMKQRMRAGPKVIPDPGLDITVKDIDRLRDLMCERQINGH
jgi:hypothetical protein